MFDVVLKHLSKILLFLFVLTISFSYSFCIEHIIYGVPVVKEQQQQKIICSYAPAPAPEPKEMMMEDWSEEW